MVFTPERIVATFIVALVLGVCWLFADREGRESMVPAAAVNWGFALLFALVLGGGLVYANTYEPGCDYLPWLGWWWCWWW